MNQFLTCKNTFWALFLALLFSGCSATTPMDARFSGAPAVRPFIDDKWLLLEDLTFEATRESDNKDFKITVPAGFVTDLASIPVPLNLIYDKTGRYSSAGILHDYLYWTQFTDRKTSDRFIKEGLKVTENGYLARNSIKYGVFWFGGGAWNRNDKEKSEGGERYVPGNMREFPSGTRWEKYKGDIDGSETPPWKLPGAKEHVQNVAKIFVESVE